MSANTYESLRVWHEAIALSKHIYKTTEMFPKHELFGLAGQMRRCAVSVASNIAEGSGRNSTKEFHHFIGIALGSLAELDTQCVIAKDIYWDEITCSAIRDAIENTRKMLSGLKATLRKTINS